MEVSPIYPICCIKKDHPKPILYSHPYSTEEKDEIDQDKKYQPSSEDGLGKILDIIV